MINIKRFVLGHLETNTYLVYNNSGDCFIVDPDYHISSLMEFLEEKHLKPTHILLTHGHSDHTGGIKRLKTDFPELLLTANIREKELLHNKKMSFANYELDADRYVKDGESLDIGSIHIDFIGTPGHTPGGMCLKTENVLFSGDTLFQSSVGRSDFPGGDEDKLFKSIAEKLFVLDPQTKVYPGHGLETTIGYEKEYNPYF